MMEDTIIAISTPLGYGGLGIVRLSGKNALAIAKKLFKPKKSKAKILPRQSILGKLYNFEQREFFEEGYLTYFPQPHTYTRENVVEISCHGSPVLLEEIVRLGIKAGARHANPGEFTLRAYLNGRIDILQAEAVNDLIQAASLQQAKISFKQLQGSLSRKILNLRKKIINLTSQIEASLEFPEENLRISPLKISKAMDKTIQSINKLIGSYKLGQTLREGIKLAITGRANVGKSTLFNSLLQQDRAMVTPYPGTTRDYLQERLPIKEAIFSLIDMAGLTNSSHPIEREAIRRGKRLAAQADGILLLFDTSRQETAEDLKLLSQYKSKRLLVVFNKIDLRSKINKNKIMSQAQAIPSVEISALKGTNLERLKDLIHKFFVPTPNQEQEVILHFHQKLLLEEILSCLARGRGLLDQGYSEEFYVEEIRKAISLMAKLTGEIKVDEIIDNIFSRFCVGK